MRSAAVAEAENKIFQALADPSRRAIFESLTRGEVAVKESVALSARNGQLTISPKADGPLRVSGPVEVVTGTGKTVNRVTGAALCARTHATTIHPGASANIVCQPRYAHVGHVRMIHL